MAFGKRFTTSNGNGYSYDHVKAGPDKTTFLLIHGCPSSRSDWRNLTPVLAEAGYGVLAVDCLGYGRSDRPANLEAYRLKHLSRQLIELLDHEQVQQVIGIGHDWGSMLLSRLYVWHPNRFSKLVFISAGYTAPGVFFDVDALNVLGQEQHGYMQLGYWYFFNSYDAEKIITSNIESFFHLAFPDDSKRWISSLAAIGGTRRWLSENTITTLPSWLTEADKRTWIRDNSQADSATWVRYYQALMRGYQHEDESELIDADRQLRVPVLGICGADDMVTRADQIGLGIRPYATCGYTEEIFEGTGHWVMLEQPERFHESLLRFARQPA